ncbi:MAG TPA: DnaA regulatory inactivator Hda [Burkholderiales bacterium]|nr:DnaA regulatory inactivator Hda [Burkholderiales bacterium]
MKQLLLDLSSAKPALSNFVRGRNGEVLEALEDLASGRSGERMVYLWGEEGCGRSHLLLACCNEAGPDSRYVACSPDTKFDFDADFTAVDDVENLGGEGQVSLFHLCNRIRERGGILLASGNLPPSRLHLRPDLATRLGWGLVYQLHVLDDGEKREALRAHAKMLGFELPSDVEDYLMNHARRDLPALVRIIDALDEYSRESKRHVTIPLLKEIMK